MVDPILWSPPGVSPAPLIPGAPHYRDFRSGLSWPVVRAELTREQRVARARGGYMFVSRGTVLGRWCQRKREAYRRHLRELSS